MSNALGAETLERGALCKLLVKDLCRQQIAEGVPRTPIGVAHRAVRQHRPKRKTFAFVQCQFGAKVSRNPASEHRALLDNMQVIRLALLRIEDNGAGRKVGDLQAFGQGPEMRGVHAVERRMLSQQLDGYVNEAT